MTKSWLIAAAAALLCPSVAQAQDGDDFRMRVGLGAQVQPEFRGGDDLEAGPLVDVDFARGTELFRPEAPDDAIDIRLIGDDRFSAGVAGNFERRRKQSDVGAPVGNVPATFEAGAFAESYLSESFRIRGELLKGIGGHKGVIGSVGGDLVLRDGDTYVLTAGPRLLFSNGRYQRAYFGVDAEAAAASSLSEYRPGSGIHAAALASGLSYQFSPQFGLFGFGRYERLVGDAAKSPIVRELGSRNQFSAGAGLSYTFTIRR